MAYADAASQAALTVATAILKNVVAVGTTIRQQATDVAAGLAEVVQRQAQIATTIAKNIPGHVWDLSLIHI